MKTTTFYLLLLFLCYFPFVLKSQWTQVVSGTNSMLNSVEVVNADTIYAGGVNVFLRSINGGQNWSVVPILNTSNQPINGLTINDLHFFNSQTGIAVGVRSNTIHTILRTTDGGSHWESVLSQNDLQGWSGGITRVDFINIMQGWCVGSSGKVRRTLNGGMSWTDMPDVQNVAYLKTVDFVNAQVGYLSTEFSFGGGQLMKTMDGGQSWTALSQGIYTELHFIHPDTGFLADQYYAFRMHDGTLNWDFMPIADGATVRRFVFQNGLSGFMLADNSVRRTRNGGQFWEEVRFPGNDPVQMKDFDWASGFQTAVAVGANGRIYRTSNGGGTATPMAYFQTDPNYVTFCKDQTIQFINPAPAAQWSSSWFVDGVLYSGANDISLSFSEYGSTYSVLLLLSNGFSSDTFQRIIQIEPSLDFQFGEVQWLQGPQICSGGNASVRVVHPTVNMTYFFSLNGEIIAQQLAYDTNAIQFQTPFLNANATLKVSAVITTFCGSVEKEETLQVEVFPFPNPNLNWSITENLCLYGQAQVTLQNTQPGIRYWLVESNIYTVSDTLEGNGGNLQFLSDPLSQPVNYQVRASNSIGCMNWIGQPIHINIDAFFLMVDTVHFYGVVNQPIQINNYTENLGSSDWNFGNSAQPATSQSATPVVTFTNSGTFPYTYQYHSQSACQGTLQGKFEIFDQASGLNGASCWSQSLLNAVYGYQYILDVKVDPQGNYWVTGAGFQQVSFWYTMNLFLNKYNPSGVLLWSKVVDPQDPANSFDYRSTYGTSIAFDVDGNAYLTGSYNADNARIFGFDFTRPTTFFSSYGQGFLFKLNPSGDVIWHSSFQANGDYEFCIPSSIVVHNNQLHLMLKAHSWQMFQPDGNIATNSLTDAAAWYIALDTAGNFVHDLPVLESFANGLLGGWYPDQVSFSTELATFKSPRLLVAPNGKLLVNGVFSGLSELHIGDVPIVPLDNTFSAKNHFIASIDPETGTCDQAFCAYGIQTPQNDFPAWEVDQAGDIYLGFGLTSAYPSYAPSIKIGANYAATTPSRSYLAKFSQSGTVLWLEKHTDQFYNNLVKTDEGDGIWALSRFDQSVGFQNPDGHGAGTSSYGGNDLLLSKIDGNGNLLGMQHFGNAEHEQAVALVSSGPGLLGIWSADDLNVNLNGPANPYTLRVWSTDQVDCPTLSGSVLEEEKYWNVYPNPFSDSFTCTFDFSVSFAPAICRLLGWNGAVIQSQKTDQLPAGSREVHFSTEGLPSGVYYLEITTQRGTSVRKIIKWKS